MSIDSITRISKNETGRKDVPRPRSRSVFTSSHVSDEMPTRDMMKLEGPPSWPPHVPKPITVKNYFTDDFNVRVPVFTTKMFSFVIN